ncbi:hypothetical protein QB910_000104 [Dabrowskivirus KKP3916]|uniref:Uncharacterized protein n=1 Tax=Alicyclobacillus phage KKP_3916 TaxID=3040651 RepID=A0AAT9V7N3_9CAUD|nr:hypothetical protein QB910_000104 [Alicyclobacillus phage KKP 3916]
MIQYGKPFNQFLSSCAVNPLALAMGSGHVNDVVNKRCKIYFLRETKFIDEPLVTIEVRDGNIRQVRGKLNRAPTPDEKAFVAEWAEKKGLKLAIY